MRTVGNANGEATLPGAFTYHAFPPSFPPADRRLNAWIPGETWNASSSQLCGEGDHLFVVWSDELSAVVDGRITCIGPDIPQSEGQSLPFGQVMIVSGSELQETHYPELERTQYASDRIEGYMLRSVPRRVWSRVSKEAAARGFCFETLGRALMSVFREKHPLLEATEVVFVTSSKEDVVQLDGIGADVRKFSGELRKLVRQQDESYDCTDYDCDTCDDKPVCDSVRELTRLRRKKTGEASANATG
jgi:CO dehydrogenase/acetyl-CoA synthase beta subunit